jgi:NitT/TauT family transport system permease protein
LEVRALREIVNLVLLVVLILAIWQVLYWILGNIALASPQQTADRLSDLFATRSFWADISESMRAIVAASALAVALGVSLGVVLGIYRQSGKVAEPILATFYSLPKVTLYPIVLLIFGLGISARIAFGVMHGVIPVTLFTMNAIQNIRLSVLRSAQALRLSGAQTVATVVLPAALPGIVTGVRVGVSTTLLGVLIGEMFAAKAGLGFRLMNAVGNQDIPTIMAIALLFSAFALAVNAALAIAVRHADRRG